MNVAVNRDEPEARWDDEIQAGALIIGAGAGGLMAALTAAQHGVDVLVLSKGRVGRSGGTICAYSAIQCPVGHEDPADSPAAFAADVVQVGRYLPNQKLVQTAAAASVEAIRILDGLGVPFEKDAGGRFRQVQLIETASHPRVMAMGETPLCGPPIALALRNGAVAAGVRFREDLYVVDLLVAAGQVVGCVAVDLRTGRLVPICTRQLVLATGALAECYQYTYFPRDATGDGHAMALRAGASLVDMEFVHFYETVLYPESVRGVNFHTPGFTGVGLRPAYNTVGEELPVAFEGSHLSGRILLDEVAKGTVTPRGGVYFDTAAIPADFYKRVGAFESGRYLPQLGIERIELGLGTFFCMGGIRVDENCRSEVAGLYAVGDAAGGFFGAKYFGATGMIFALSSGLVAGRALAAASAGHGDGGLAAEQVEAGAGPVLALLAGSIDGAAQRPHQIRAELQSVMNHDVGPVRSQSGLERAIDRIQALQQTPVRVATRASAYNTDLLEALQLRNLLDAAMAVARASLVREESRGDFRRSDYPEERSAWVRNTAARQGGDGHLAVSVQPVAFTFLAPPRGEDQHDAAQGHSSGLSV